MAWAAVATNALAAVLGIDYGQEFTKSSLVAPGVPFEIVLTPDSKRKDLSGIVLKNNQGDIERIYGNAASSLLSRFPESSAFYLKPLVGKSLDDSDEDVAEYRTQFPGLQLTPSNNNRQTIAAKIHGETYAVEELIAMNFAEIKARAAKLLAANMGAGYVKEAAVSVPGHFTVPQRRALADAVSIAGLELIALVNDGVGVAANLATRRNDFGEDKEYHIVYDVGAGSTTATLVSIRTGNITEPNSTPTVGTIIEVEGFGYDDQLGGQLLTERIRELLIDKVVEKTKIKKNALLKDNRALARLWREAERVKMILNANSETYASVESIQGDVDFRGLITRDEFEQATADLAKSVAHPIRDALDNPLAPDAQPFKISDINSVILTGGSSRVRFIQESLGSVFDDPSIIAKNVNADEAAVLGTTLRGVGISKIFKSKPMHVVDRAIWDYEVEVDGKKSTLFPRGTELNSASIITLDPESSATVVTMYENGEDIGTYNITGIQNAVKALSSDNYKKCVGDVSVRAVLSLSNSRTLGVDSVFAECQAVEKPKPSKSTSVTESKENSEAATSTSAVEDDDGTSEPDEAETASTTSETTASAKPSEKPPQPFRKQISYKQKYNGPRPMGSASKQSAVSRLRSMDRADSDRLAKEHSRNEIESEIYRMRDSATDDILDALAEIHDWLETDGQKASLSELKNKHKQLKSLVGGEKAEETTGTASTRAAEVSDVPVDDKDFDDEEEQKFVRYNPMDNVNKHFIKVLELMQELGVSLDDDLGLDIKNLDNYAKEAIEDDSARLKLLKESRDALKKVMADGKNMKDSEKEKLRRKLKENTESIQELTGVMERNIERRFQALGEVIKNAVQSKSMAAEASAKTQSPVHDDL